MDPAKVLSLDAKGKYVTMMDDIDELSDADKKTLLANCREMEQNPFKVIMGKGRLAAINKKVGERIKVTSMNYKGLDLEMEIIGDLPGARYEQNAVMNYEYLDEAIQAYNKGKSKEQQHPMTEKSLALMFLRVPDVPTYDKVAEQITNSPEYRSPAVKCETLSSGIASFLDGYKDLLFGMRWLLVPSLLVTISLVIANAISISVRERRSRDGGAQSAGLLAESDSVVGSVRGAVDRLLERRAQRGLGLVAGESTCSAAFALPIGVLQQLLH